MFIEPKATASENEQLRGDFEGIGATVNTVNGQTVIVAPVPGSPAEQAGLKAGDIIVKVDGKDVSSLALDEVVARRFLRITLQAPGRYEFSHELARHATYNLLPVARRRALHRAAVQALRERGGRDALTRAAVRYHRGRAESVALQAGRWAKRAELAMRAMVSIETRMSCGRRNT